MTKYCDISHIKKTVDSLIGFRENQKDLVWELIEDGYNRGIRIGERNALSTEGEQ